jgi:predicted RNase H-like nuclease (RuvC/YqgF family)
VSAVAESGGGALPPEWGRLERSGEAAALRLKEWVRRARESEQELERLRLSLEELAAERSGSGDLEQEVRRLKAENAALHSRMLQARKRVETLLQRLSALGIEP